MLTVPNEDTTWFMPVDTLALNALFDFSEKSGFISIKESKKNLFVLVPIEVYTPVL